MEAMRQQASLEKRTSIPLEELPLDLVGDLRHVVQSVARGNGAVPFQFGCWLWLNLP